MDNSPKQRKIMIIAVAAILFHTKECSLTSFVYIIDLGYDVINHKNADVRLNVTGVDSSRSGSEPGFEPGSQYPCERGERQWKFKYHLSHACVVVECAFG